MARVYRYSTAALIRRVLLPAVLPTYLIGLRSGLALGWMFVVAAELVGASQGLSYLLADGQQTGKSGIIIAIAAQGPARRDRRRVPGAAAYALAQGRELHITAASGRTAISAPLLRAAI